MTCVIVTRRPNDNNHPVLQISYGYNSLFTVIMAQIRNVDYHAVEHTHRVIKIQSAQS